MYVSKCPKCGSSNIDSYGEWDIVTDQECDDCGWSKCYGSVGGFAGSQYLVRCEEYPDYDYDDSDYDHDEPDCNESDKGEFCVVIDDEDSNVSTTPQAVMFYPNFEEDDDLPF